MQMKTELVGCLEITFFSTHKNGDQNVRKKKEWEKDARHIPLAYKVNKHFVVFVDINSCLLL